MSELRSTPDEGIIGGVLVFGKNGDAIFQILAVMLKGTRAEKRMPTSFSGEHMSRAYQNALSGREIFFDKDEIIVSKTDVRGHITYANRVFQRVSGYTEAELLGKAHSLIRHPEMPRCVFKYLWDTIAAGDEVFAYVVNRAKNGDHYWVFAHVTPTFDARGNITGYHSNRRLPARAAVAKVVPLYRRLCDLERGHVSAKDAIAVSMPAFAAFLEQSHLSYEELVFTL